MSFESDIEAVIAALEEAAERGLQAGADLLLDESNRLAPIETGDLIRSGNTAVDSDHAEVGYNGVYAVPQHERLDWHHDAGRQAKFLETAAHRHADRIIDAVADEFRDALS